MEAGRPDLVAILKGLEGRRFPGNANERVTDFEAMRIHVYSDSQVGGRVQNRFERYGTQSRQGMQQARQSRRFQHLPGSRWEIGAQEIAPGELSSGKVPAGKPELLYEACARVEQGRSQEPDGHSGRPPRAPCPLALLRRLLPRSGQRTE